MSTVIQTGDVLQSMDSSVGNCDGDGIKGLETPIDEGGLNFTAPQKDEINHFFSSKLH